MEEGSDGWVALRDAGRSRHFARGERVVLDGARPGVVMLIQRGRVRIAATTPEGDEVTLAVRGPGDLVGDHSALLGRHSDAAVIGLEAGEMLIVPADRYLEAIEAHPTLLHDQVRRLVHRLQESDRRLVELATLDVEGRVVRALLRYAEPVPRDTSLTVPLSQDELAGLCGASRGAVAEVLGTLRTAEVLTTERRRITITDPDALERLDAR